MKCLNLIIQCAWTGNSHIVIFFPLTPRRGESTQKMKITRKGISHHQVNLGQDPMMANIRLPFGKQDIFLVG